MRILHITPSLLGGGVGAVICHLANEMAKEHDVTVCSIFEPKETDLFWHRLSPQVKKGTCHKTAKGVSLKVLKDIARFIRDGRYDVVHIHCFLTYYLLAIAVCPRKTKFFYTIHSDAEKENVRWDARLLMIKKWLFRTKRVVPISVSKVSQESFERLYRCSCHLVYNAIPEPKLPKETNSLIASARLTPATKVFVNPARIDEPKNQVVLCKVFKRLIEEGEDVVLLIAGWKAKPYIYEALEPLLCDRIRYIGERTDIQQLLRDSNGMCLPSIYEGLPMVLLEALAVGCTPICAPVGGIVNVIENGVNGFLSRSSDFEDYYQTMHTYLHLEEKQIEEIKEEARKSFVKYDIAFAAKEYCKIYEQA